MPFKSEKQRKLCWTLYNRAVKKGSKPKWDCEEWEKETNNSKMSRTNSKKNSRKNSRKGSKKGSRKGSNKTKRNSRSRK